LNDADFPIGTVPKLKEVGDTIGSNSLTQAWGAWVVPVSADAAEKFMKFSDFVSVE